MKGKVKSLEEAELLCSSPGVFGYDLCFLGSGGAIAAGCTVVMKPSVDISEDR